MAGGRASYVFHVAVFAFGAIALGFLLQRLGWAGIQHVVIDAAPWFALIAAIDVASMCCDAIALHAFLGRRVGYLRVFAAQASGLAINRLTPANSVGEAVKVTMLSRSMPVDFAISAVVLFNLTTIYLGIAAIVVGVPVTALMLDLPDRVAIAVWIGTAVLVTLAIVVAVIVRRGAVSTLIDVLAKVHAISHARAERWRGKITDLDARVRAAPGLRRGIAGVLGSRVFNWLGTIVVLRACGIAMTAPIVIAMLSVGILVTWMSNVIPLGLGLADGTNYVLYGLLGASPAAGLVFTMVNRVRTCAIAVIGLSVMAISGRLRARDRTSAPDPRR
jgi:uncharacterized protein (TIRG00374 family)